jgi:undecaprenyl-diphosphatase
MNQLIFNFIFSLSQNPVLAGISVFISNIFTYILCVFIVVFIFYNMRPLILNFFILAGSLVSAWAASKILKTLLHIPRPFITNNLIPLVYETGFSLPSTHATIFATLAVVVLSMNRKLGIIFSIGALLIGISRVVLGVHYPLDVLVGFFLGSIIGLVFVQLGKSPRLVAILGKSL